MGDAAGIRHPYGLMIAHGMHTMTHPDIIKTQHPDWFALYGGKRLNHLCYSNEELLDSGIEMSAIRENGHVFKMSEKR